MLESRRRRESDDRRQPAFGLLAPVPKAPEDERGGEPAAQASRVADPAGQLRGEHHEPLRPRVRSVEHRLHHLRRAVTHAQQVGHAPSQVCRRDRRKAATGTSRPRARGSGSTDPRHIGHARERRVGGFETVRHSRAVGPELSATRPPPGCDFPRVGIRAPADLLRPVRADTVVVSHLNVQSAPPRRAGTRRRTLSPVRR